ncbi:acetyltransferase [Parendozoicomonas sp. Alg238-R29]|uniref:acetyltransferase n=1 Tax=Parendozoicomonas sp. Alg238-R29 TaxID=2993446 RepID=UPI00248D7854|nr:acetyltransferase [Parendozoicomonas sp. Alg238-R29]
MKRIVVFGAGGAGKAVLNIINDVNKEQLQWDVAGFFDDDEKLCDTSVLAFPVIGGIDSLINRYEELGRPGVVISIGTPSVRKLVFDRLVLSGISNFPKIIHPLAYIPDSVKVGNGTVVYPHVTIDPDVIISELAFINKNVSIGHDASISNFAVVSPNVSIGGYVNVNESCFIGMGAQIIQGVSLGNSSVVGAGAVVIDDVTANSKVVGVPAKSIS